MRPNICGAQGGQDVGQPAWSGSAQKGLCAREGQEPASGKEGAGAMAGATVAEAWALSPQHRPQVEGSAGPTPHPASGRGAEAGLPAPDGPPHPALCCPPLPRLSSSRLACLGGLL